ncbi:N-acetylglucosaminyl deacetylase, LmbE family [Mucilaginibacter mallensis]|uniref:N-acetylglucosaminyl deacetylase, LmbE family n=1 Tax=Mucilaginibacter mallensis TaxID=652787 RepID=A0A1H1YS45_MUCMA|nr:PIG-L family deacetylase [Mucilaginibacter mallensis]SDT24278.1 N-acetylglucosaminyl deacetylase, LmbE family [Mucilaginibacter mallensis]
MLRFPILRYIVFLIFCCLSINSNAQINNKVPHVLVVIAHPDDESVFSVTLYKIAKEHHGIIDLFVITDGEAGYKYATLAESYYGLVLTDQKIGRSELPRIRKRELKNAGHVLGVAHYYFMNQEDSHYGLSEHDPLDTSWDVKAVNKKLNKLLADNHYDLVFCLLPEPSTHGAHKAASLLALNAIAKMPTNKRPLILGAITHDKTDSVTEFSQYKDYEITQTVTDKPLFSIDRTACFSYRNKVNYKVIANWELAEHKSQGFTQMSMNDGDVEEFWYFKLNGTAGITKCDSLFKLLSLVPYAQKIY